MDFHGLTRRELQALCKKNKIPANQTNVAMADALQALSTVEGIEEILHSDVSQNPQVPVELRTPNVSRTSQRSTRKKPAVPSDGEVIKLEDSSAPVTRTSRRGTAASTSVSRRKILSEEKAKEEASDASHVRMKADNVEILQTPTMIKLEDSSAPVTRTSRRGTAASTSVSRRKILSEEKAKEEASDASHVRMKADNVEILQTPTRTHNAAERRATVTRSVRRMIEAQSTMEKENLRPSEMYTRRSARLISGNKDVELPSSIKSTRKKVAVKIAALTEEMEDLTINLPESDMGTNMQKPSESADEADRFSEPHDLQNGGGAKYDKPNSDSEVEVPDKRNDGVPISVSESKTLEEEHAGDSSSKEVVGVTLVLDIENEKDRVMDKNEELKPVVETLEVISGDLHSPYTCEDIQCEKIADTLNMLYDEPFPSVEEMSLSKHIKLELVDGTGMGLKQGDERKSVCQPSSSKVAEDEDKNISMDHCIEKMDNLSIGDMVLEDNFEVEVEEADYKHEHLADDLNVRENKLPFLSNQKFEGQASNLEVNGDGKEVPKKIMPAPEVENASHAYQKFEGHTSNSGINEDAEEVPKKIMPAPEVENTSLPSNEVSSGVLSEGNKMDEVLRSLNSALTELKIEEYERVAGLAMDVSNDKTNMFIGELPVEILADSELPLLNSEGVVNEHEEPENLVLKDKKEADDIPIFSTVKEFEVYGLMGYNLLTTPRRMINEISVSDQVPRTPILADIVSEESLEPESERALLVGNVKTPKKKGSTTATPRKSNGKKKVSDDVDKENNGVHSVKRGSAKKVMGTVVKIEEKKNKYEQLSLRKLRVQLKDLYKEKATEVRKSSALQPRNQNCLLGDETK